MPSKHKMNPKTRDTLAYMGVSLVKAIETSHFEERLERLEQGRTSCGR